MQKIVCEGVITQSVEGFAMCSTGWVAQPASIPFDYSQLDPPVVAAVFGAGFSLYVTVWAAGWGASQILKLLR